MILSNNESHIQRDEDDNVGKLLVPSHIQQTALVERQSFLEKSYYPNPPPGMNKAITPEMKRAIIQPLEDCIASSSNDTNGKNGIHARSTPTLRDWQEGKAPLLSFAEFKQLVSEEHKQNEEVDGTLLLEVFIIRSIEESLHHVDDRNTVALNSDLQKAIRYAISPPKITLGSNILDSDTLKSINSDSPMIFTAEQSSQYESAVSSMQKLMKVIEQMKKNGIEATRQCYKSIHEIESAHTPKELDVTRTKMMDAYPMIRAYEVESNGVKKANMSEYLDELSENILHNLRLKTELLREESEHADELRINKDMDVLAKKLGRLFGEGYTYLESLIPDEHRRTQDKSPYYVLKFITELRKKFPVAKAEVLAELWWQMRLGGDRAKDIYKHLKTEVPRFVEQNHLEQYTKHLADNYLSSEAAGFEFQKNITLTEGATPNKLLYQTMKNLIKNHIPKDQEYIRFTILDGEQKYKKIIIPYHDGMTDTEIYEGINNGVKVSKWNGADLTDRERASLSYKGHNAQERLKDPNYQRIYGDFGRDAGSGEEYKGDYLVQIGSPHADSREPRSLFAVDSHQVAIQLNFHEAGKVNLTFRYNHVDFDGVPASVHTATIEKGYSSPILAVSILPLKGDNVKKRLFSTLYTAENKKPVPLIEARADYDDNNTHTTTNLGEQSSITKTEMRSLMLARANGIDYFQQLVLRKSSGGYFERNINYNNIQPVVIAPSQLTAENKIAWAQGVRNAVKRAEEDVGDVALIAAIAGTKEAPLAQVGSILNPHLTNMLNHSQGMISAVLSESPFTTAISNAYRPSKIDLNDPVPSMGVIGVALHDKKAHYTVRLLPSQAQKQFKNAVLALCIDRLPEKGRQKVLSEFTKIISAWDQLVGGTGKPITLEAYEKIRDGILHQLVMEGYVRNDGTINTGEKLQAHLNETLQKAAKEVFNTEKMEVAKQELLTLFTSE